jgi:hypothetical protein
VWWWLLGRVFRFVDGRLAGLVRAAGCAGSALRRWGPAAGARSGRLPLPWLVDAATVETRAARGGVGVLEMGGVGSADTAARLGFPFSAGAGQEVAVAGVGAGDVAGAVTGAVVVVSTASAVEVAALVHGQDSALRADRGDAVAGASAGEEDDGAKSVDAGDTGVALEAEADALVRRRSGRDRKAVSRRAREAMRSPDADIGGSRGVEAVDGEVPSTAVGAMAPSKMAGSPRQGSTRDTCPSLGRYASAPDRCWVVASRGVLWNNTQSGEGAGPPSW